MRESRCRPSKRQRIPADRVRCGTLSRRAVSASETHDYLFTSAANAARLREAIEDSRADRNMVPFTIEQLRREFAPRSEIHSREGSSDDLLERLPGNLERLPQACEAVDAGRGRVMTTEELRREVGLDPS